MQDRNTLVLLKKVTRAQRDIRRTDRLLTCLYKMADNNRVLAKQVPNAERYRNIHTKEPLWFIAFGTVISAFLPALLVVWSYYYMRFESVEYAQIPGMIGIAIVIAFVCGFIRLFAALFRSLDEKAGSFKKFISAAEYTKSLAQNAVCRALDTMEIPEHCKEPDILSAIYQYLIRHKNPSRRCAYHVRASTPVGRKGHKTRAGRHLLSPAQSEKECKQADPALLLLTDGISFLHTEKIHKENGCFSVTEKHPFFDFSFKPAEKAHSPSFSAYTPERHARRRPFRRRRPPRYPAWTARRT